MNGLDLDVALEQYCDAQANLAHILVALCDELGAHGEKRPAILRSLAGLCAIPIRQVERLEAFGRADIEAHNGVSPETYGEILRKKPLPDSADLLAAAETGRWNVDTAHDAVKATRVRRKVQREQVYSAMRQAETICGGAVTAERVLGLFTEERLELRKPLSTVARFAGQDYTP